jgi:hypothetical protein
MMACIDYLCEKEILLVLDNAEEAFAKDKSTFRESIRILLMKTQNS